MDSNILAIEGLPELGAVLNNLALLGLGVLQAWAMWRSKRNHAGSQKEIAEVKATANDIKIAVNGPLGVALSAAASAQETLARLTQDPKIILEAVQSRKMSDDHKRAQYKIALDKQNSELEKQTIIRDFLAEEKGKENRE